MIDEEFVVTRLEYRIEFLTRQKEILIEKELITNRYWSISGIISGLQEALDLLTQ